MPKKAGRDKKFGGQTRTRASRNAPRHIPGIAELLARQALSNVRGRDAAADAAIAAWLPALLPADLQAHVTRVTLNGDQLSIRADSASWGARLRYALAALEPDIRARLNQVKTLRVRVTLR
jgi:hypothetical protein